MQISQMKYPSGILYTEYITDLHYVQTEGVDLNRFNTVVIWCETFGQFITSAQIK